MNWGALVEQALATGLTQLAVALFVVGVAVGIAIVLMQRHR